jgi:hypothetical protein
MRYSGKAYYTKGTLIFFIGLARVLGLAAIQTKKESFPLGVKYEVLGQRHLSEDEINELGNLYGIKLAVRIRLTNTSPYHVLYLSNAGTIVPAGYHLFREPGKRIGYQHQTREGGRDHPVLSLPAVPIRG